MVKVIAETDDGVVIMNDENMKIDAVSKKQATLGLKFGLKCNGLSLSSNGTLEVSDKYFIPLETDSDEDDYDDYSEYEDDEEEVEDDEDTEDTEDSYEDYDSDDEDVEDDSEDDYDYEDYEDYEDEPEESKVSQLYRFLTPEQQSVIKRYYLWYSQRIFKNNQVGSQNILTLKSSKQVKNKLAQMSKIRSNGGLWHYAGFVDMGYHGAGHCSFGHALRYAHLAWDVTVSDIEETFFGENCTTDIEDIINSDACIVFGVVCISDFFEASPDTVSLIQKAQRESISDMERMLGYYLDGTIEDAKNSLKFMDEVVSKVKKYEARQMLANKEPIMDKLLLQFYIQFREADMLPPKALVQEIRNNLVGWSSTKIVGRLHSHSYTALSRTADIVYGKTYKSIKENSNAQALLTDIIAVQFEYDMCGVYKYNADTQKDEGGASKQAKWELQSLYRRLPKDYTLEASYLGVVEQMASVMTEVSEYMNKFAWYRFSEGEVFDTENPFVGYSRYLRSLISEKYERDYVHSGDNIVNEIYNCFRTYEDCKGYVRSSGCLKTMNILTDLLSVIPSLLEKYNKFKDYMINKDKAEYEAKIKAEEEKKQKAEEEEAKRLAESASKETDDDYNARVSKEALEYLIAHKSDVEALQQDYYSFGKNLIKQYRTGSVSDNKMLYMMPIYNALTGKNYLLRGVSGVTYIDDELRGILKWCLDHKDKVEDEHTYSILCSVYYNQIYSYRQNGYVKKAKEIYKDNN